MMKMGLSFLPDGPDHRLAGHIAVDVPANYYDVIKEVPGYGWAARARMCTVPKSWPAALALGAIAAKYGFTLAPDEEVLAWYKRNQAEWKTMREASAILSGELVKEEGFSYYPHQITGADWLLLSTETTGRALLDQTGCLAGDTLINVNRAGKGSRMRIDHIVKRMNQTGGSVSGGQAWDLSIPTRVARDASGVVMLGTLDAAWFSGIKETFTLATDSGRTIRATATHPFFTEEGWVNLGDISTGMSVHVNSGRSVRGKVAPKAYYRQTFGMQAHPYRHIRNNTVERRERGWKPQWAVAEHRLVAEAALNGLSTEVFIDKVRSGETTGLFFLDPAEFDVHHIDLNSQNNALENLSVLTSSAHHALHAREGKVRNVLEQVGTEKVISIVKFGEEPTYDLRLVDDPHNFMANGFVVHNSGKTGTFIHAIQKGNLTEKGPVLVICPESVMGTGWDQGMEKFAPELRTVQITGTATQRRKKMEAIRDGEFDVAIIGYSNLRTSTRLEAMPGHALRKCIACGGPRLTSGKVDENGNPLPDIQPHDTSVGDRDFGTGSQALCTTDGCQWKGTLFRGEGHSDLAVAEAQEHDQTAGKKIREISIAQCQTHMKELNEIGWSVIIADEAHRVLNHQSQTAQALNGVAHYGPSDPLRWAATGTPISTKVEQVWSILHFLDPVAWPSRTKWVEWHCVKGYNNYGFLEWQGLKEKRQVEFDSTWSAITRRVLKEQVLDLPPQLRWGSLEERLTMPRNSEQYRVYHEMKAEMLAMVDEGEITAQNALVQAGRLSMLASGTGFPIGQDGELGLKMPSVKVDALIQMWEDGEWEGEQLAVLFNSRKALRMTEDALYGAKLIRPETVSVVAGDVSQSRRSEDINDFQSGKRKTVLLTYGAGGTGITLTAASTVVVFERAWSPILNAQGIDRFHRIGSERHKAITYRDLVVAGTIEVKQLDRMAQNDERLESIVHDRAKLRDLFGG